MRIVRFSTPNDQSYPFQDQKISLSKLSQVKAHFNHQFSQQVPTFNYNSNKKPHQQSHIKWVPEAVTGAILNEVENIISPGKNVMVSPMKIPRKKIFQEKSINLKQNIQIPTFSKMPSAKNIPDEEVNSLQNQQTHYYSMTINSPRQEKFNLVGSKISDSKQYRSPFKTNEDNSRIDSQSHTMLNSQTNSIEKSSIAELTEFHIPRLQQKLKEHDEELSTIKKYLKNTEQLNTLREEIHQIEDLQAVTEKQKEVERKRELLMLSIEEAREKQRCSMKKKQEDVDSRIEQIEQKRLRRLEKIQRENERLYENLKYYSHDQQPQFQSNTQQDYQFYGPVAFPSKDWESQRQIMAPMSDGFHKTSNTTNHFRKNKAYQSGQMNLSPVLKKQLHQISSIGFSSNNKTESFSMDANTFREIMSPLEFQGENQPW